MKVGLLPLKLYVVIITSHTTDVMTINIKDLKSAIPISVRTVMAEVYHSIRRAT